MKRHIKLLAVLVLAAVTALVSMTGCSGGGGSDIAALDEEAPDFRLETTDGRELSLSDFKGKPVLLNFWATYCGPCRYEMPLLQQVHVDPVWTARGLVILAVNLGESSATASGFMDENSYSFTVMLDATGEVGARYNTRYIPTTYFIDKDGIIRNVKIGAFQSRAQIDQMLLDLVEE